MSGGDWTDDVGQAVALASDPSTSAAQLHEIVRTWLYGWLAITSMTEMDDNERQLVIALALNPSLSLADWNYLFDEAFVDQEGVNDPVMLALGQNPALPLLALDDMNVIGRLRERELERMEAWISFEVTKHLLLNRRQVPWPLLQLLKRRRPELVDAPGETGALVRRLWTIVDDLDQPALSAWTAEMHAHPLYMPQPPDEGPGYDRAEDGWNGHVQQVVDFLVFMLDHRRMFFSNVRLYWQGLSNTLLYGGDLQQNDPVEVRLAAARVYTEELRQAYPSLPIYRPMAAWLPG